MRALVVAMLFAVPSVVSAQSMVGQWILDSGSDGTPFMAATNDSGSWIGKWCDGELEKCFWMLALQTPCTSGATIPALLSSPIGASSVTLRCLTPHLIGGKQMHRLVIEEYSLMTSVAKAEGTIGLATAIEDGSFRVNRFLLTGGASASALMESAELAYITKKTRRTTKDRIL